MCVCVCRFVCLYVCVCGSACREENGGKNAADAQAQVAAEDAEENGGKSAAAETAANGGKSAAAETAANGDGKRASVESATEKRCHYKNRLKKCKGDATRESATEIADKNQVVFFFSYAALRCSPPLSDSATLRHCNCGVFRHSQKIVFCCYACPSAVSTAA